MNYAHASFNVVIAMLLLVQIRTVGQSSETNILNRKIDINLSKATLLETLNILAIYHRVPIGLERDTDYRQRIAQLMYVENGKIKWKDGTITIKSGTLKEILDSLVAQEPLYQWEVRDGVINVFPTQSRDEFLKKLLETNIEKFSPKKGINKFKLRDVIVDLSEIKALLEAENIEVIKRYYPTRRSIYTNDEVDLSISNTNVRGVLNKVARDSEHKIWVVERIGDKKEFLEVSF